MLTIYAITFRMQMVRKHSQTKVTHKYMDNSLKRCCTGHISCKNRDLSEAISHK